MYILLSILVNILSFGAVAGDSKVNNAAAINRAIDHCSQKGGGTVEVPRGVFSTGTVHLRSHVTLRLERGAVLRGTADINAYEPLHTGLDLSQYESGRGTVNYNSATDPQWSRAMLMATECTDIAIEGEGCIDGADVRNPLGEEHMRGPHTILMAGCSRVRMSGFTVKRSANYAFLAYKIDRARFEGITVEGGWDGIHIRGCRDTRITGCRLHTGDDAIAGGYWEGMRISRCTLNSSCNGIRMIMPSADVLVSRCHIYGPGTYEHITSRRTNSEAAVNLEPGGWGKAPGRMDRIRLSHITADRVLTPLCVTLGDDNTCGTITVDHLVATRTTRMAMSVKSWGNAPTDKVVMRHCRMEFDGIDDPALPGTIANLPTSQWPVFPSWGMYFRNVGEVVADDVELSLSGNDYRPPFATQNVGKSNLRKGVKIGK